MFSQNFKILVETQLILQDFGKVKKNKHNFPKTTTTTKKWVLCTCKTGVFPLSLLLPNHSLWHYLVARDSRFLSSLSKKKK